MAVDRKGEVQQLLSEAVRNFSRASKQWEAGIITDTELREQYLKVGTLLAKTLQVLEEDEADKT